MIKWTHRALISLKHSGTDLFLRDPKGQGLALKVTKSRKTWVWRGRVHSYPRVITLGKFPSLTLADARALARRIVVDRDEGRDVYRLHGSGKASSVGDQSQAVMTCQQAWDQYIQSLEAGTNLHGKSRNRPNTISCKRGAWSRRFAATIGSRPITAVTSDDLFDIVQGIRDAGEMAAANAAVAYIKAFFRWSKAERRATGLSENPAEDLVVSAGAGRDRFLSATEVRYLWQALDQQPEVWADAYRLALLTGQRRNEIFGLTVSEIDARERHIEIAAERMKNGKPHIVPVGDIAWDVLERRMQLTKSQHLFPSFDTRADVHLSGFSKGQKRVREAVTRIAAVDGVALPHWTFHDLRRTFTSHANSLRDQSGNRLVAKDHIERVLSHAIGGVAGVYDRHDYYVEKRRVLRAWEARLMEMIGRS